MNLPTFKNPTSSDVMDFYYYLVAHHAPVSLGIDDIDGVALPEDSHAMVKHLADKTGVPAYHEMVVGLLNACVAHFEVPALDFNITNITAFEFNSANLAKLYENWLANDCQSREADFANEWGQFDEQALFELFEVMGFDEIAPKFEGMLSLDTNTLEDIFFYHQRLGADCLSVAYQISSYHIFDDTPQSCALSYLPTFFVLFERCGTW